MKVVMYGAPICKDCVAAKEQLLLCDSVTLEYHNITESTTCLKEFLTFRDNDAMFEDIKNAGKIGIPFFILEDGTKTFEIEKYVAVDLASSMQEGQGCSLDGKGHC